MKFFSGLLLMLLLVGISGVGFCEEASNPLAVGMEKITKAPFTMLKNGNEHLASPIKDVDAAALDFTDNVRAATVSVGTNLGQPVKE